MSSSNTPNSNTSAAAVQATGAAASLTAAAKAAVAKAAASDAGLQDAIAKGYQPARILGGKVVGVWGGALLRTADGEMRPLKTGDVIKKGDVVLTTQDGIVQIEGAKTTNSALIDRVIADIGTPKPDEPTGVGVQGPGGGDNFLPGLRVDRVVEAVTPAGLGFTEVAADTEEIQFDTAADELAAAELAALPDVFTGNEDTPIVFNPTTNDSAGNAGPLLVTSIAGQPISVGSPVTLPQGVVTLNPDGTLTFTPNANFNGQVNFPYVATTPNGSTVTSTVTLNVTPVNDAPEGTDAIRQTYEDVPYVLQTKDFGFKDVDNDTLAAVRIDTLPTNGRLTLNGQPVTDDQIISAADIAAGRLQFVPDADENGTPYGSFTFSVQDSGGAFDAAPNRFTLNVDPLAETPAANNDAMKTEEGKPVVIDVLANDKTPTGTTLTVTEINGKPVTPGTPVPITDSTGQPIGNVVVTPDGKVTFTPAPNYQGPADFTYTATDGKTPVEGKVHVDVTPVNDVPLAADDKATIEAGKPTTLDVLGNDTDPDKDPLTISEINGQPVTPGTPVTLLDPVTKQPVGTVTVTPEGKITFNPAPGVEGPVTFEYTVKDPSGATDKATVTLDVGGVNDAPVAQADVGSTTEDAILTVSAANGVIQSGAAPAGRDSDVDGDSLAVSTVAFGNTAGKVGSPIAGAFGTLTLNADGSYSYVPNAAAQALDTGESESDVFTYTVTDPAGKTATTTLTITVTGVNDGPVAIDDSALTPVGTPVTIPVLGNDTDPDGEPLTVTQVDGKPISPGNPVSLVDPVGNPVGTVALNPDGSLTFTPAPGYEGPVDFPYTVTDGTTTDTANVHVVVSSTNRPPVADDNFVQGIEGTPVTFDPRSNDYDPDTDPIAITQINGKPIAVGSPVTLPEGTVALNPDGTLTFTPVKNFDGPVTFEYTIADGRSGTDTAKVVIDVAPLDNSPAANDDVATTPEDTPVLVDVLANDKDLDGEPLTITEIDGKPAVVGTPVTITDDKGTPIATVTLTPEGKLNVVPAPNYNGPIEFPYTVTDGDTPVEATVTVNVTPVNDAPVANDDKATVPGDTPTTLDVLGNDTDPDKDPLTISEINGQPVTPGTPVELKDPVTGQPVGTVTVTPEGKITFNPAPGVEGPVTFEYTVKDPSGATDKATVTLDVGGVNDAPVAQADVGSTTEDAILTVSAANGVIQSGAAPAGRDSDVDGDSLAVSTVAFGNTAGKVGSPIAGAFGSLTLNADGSYSYVPNAAAQGLDTGESESDVFTYTVTDPAGKTATTTLTITVTGVNDGPVAIDDSALTPVGTPVTIPVLSNDTDPDGEPLTVTQVDGKPISPGNPVSLVDPVGNPVGTVALNPDGSLTFTPAPGYEGPVDFPYTVTDGTTTDTANVHVVVSSTNRPPVADDNFVQGIEGTPVTFDPRSNDYDPDTDPIAITQINGKPIAVGSPVTLPEGTVALNPDGTLTFTPVKNFDGPVTFEYTIADGRSGTDTAKVVIDVAPLDNSPAANDDVATTPEDTPVLVDVLANDKDLDGEPLTITEIDGKPAVVGTPVTITDDKGTPIATVTLTPEGKLNVVPAPNYNGPIEFPYTVTDGDTPVEATVTVNVTPVNDAPVANDDKATVPGDTPTTLDVLGNDTDPDKDPLTISEINGQPVTPGTPVELKDPVTGQPVGTVTVTPEGKITFNPAPGVEGPVTFEYTVKDPSGATDKATVTLDVGGVNDAPVAQADVGSTTEDAILTVSAANGVIQSGAAPAGRDSDVDGDSLAVSTVAFGNTAGKVGSPIAGAFGTLTLNADGSYSYVPNAAAQGLDTGESQSDVFTYTVTDPAGKTATTTLTITVTGVNDGPVAIDDSALTPVGTPVTIPVLSNDTDPDGEPLTVTEVDGKPISPGNPVSLVDPVGNPIGTVALNPDGSLTFTPAPGYEGPVDFPYTVTDGTTTDTANVHVVVSSTNRPPVADDNFVQGIEGTPVTFDPRSNDYDPDTDPIAITQINGKPIAVGSPVTLPEGTVALNPDGTLTFTPVKNFDGPVTFEYTIADGRSGTDTAKVVIDVAPLDNSPAANDDVATTPEDTPVLVDVLANDKDLDGEPLTITEIDGKPAVVGTPVTITDDKGTPIATVTLTPEGKLNVVPAPNYNGPIEFPYTVTDGDTPVEATVTVNVTPVNDAPVANDDKATVPGDTPTTLDVLGNDTDPDKDPLTISEINGQPVTPGTPVELKDPVTGQPVGTVTVTPEGKITFNPAPGVEGPVTFEYTVKDPSGATDKATVTLDVGGVNDAPVAQADVGSTTEDAILTVSAANGVIQSGAAPAGRDSDVDGDSLAVSTVAFGNTAGKVGSPIAGAFGSLTLNADGSYSYVPNAAAQGLDTGESESDVFTYTVTDPAGKTATTTLTITVTGVNDGPVAIDDSALTPVGTPVTIPVLSNDTDPDGEPLTVTQVDGKPISPGNPVSLVDPVGNPVGTVALNPDGSLTFTPAPGYEGPVDFPYTVTDGTTTDTANVHIVVSDNNRPPQAGDNVVDGQEDTPVTFDPRSNDFDPDTDPLTITEINGQPIEPGQSVDLPQGKVSMNPDGTLTFTPNANFTGPVKFDYTVEDGRGGADVAQVTINVANTNDLPEGADKTERTPEDTPYVLRTEDFGFSDVDGDTFAGVRIDKLPTAGKLTLNGQDVGVNQFVSAQDIADGKLKYEPAANENGLPYGSFDFSVRDSQGSFDAKPNTFTLNVGELDDSPSAVDDTATTAEDTAVIVDVLKNDSDPDKEDTLSIVAIDGQPAVVGQPVSISKDGVVIATVTLTADGKLSVLPAPNYNTEGKDPITFNYTITDGRTEVKAKVEVVVTPVNDGPNAVDDKATIAEDTPQVVKLVDNDSDPDNAKADLKVTNIAGQDVKPGDTVEIKDASGKLLATVTLNPNGQDVTVDPVANYVGPVNFSYTITDPQGLKDTANVTVDVGGVNDAPEARPDVGNTNEDTSLVVNAANGVIQSGLNAGGKDTDIDGDSLSVSAVAFGNVVGKVGEALQGKYGALTLNEDGSYSFIPNSTANALDDGETGQDVFTYTVTDPGGKTATTTLTINVAGRNDGPVAIDDAKKTDEDTPVTLNLVANDVDDDGEPLTITQINGTNVKPGDVVEISNAKGKVGDLLINADGTVTFTPVLDYNGPVDFTYTVSDGTASDEGAVRITVGPSNDAPDARDDLVQGEEDNTVTFDPVTSNDTDPDKDPLTITQVAGQPISVGNPVTVPEGKVSLNPDGTLSFTPNKDFNGPVAFTYTISDGNGGTDTATIRLDIKPINDAPTDGDETNTVVEDTLLTVANGAAGDLLNNANDVDGDTLTITGYTIAGIAGTQPVGQAVTIPGVGSITINANGSYSFNPALNYAGNIPVITYTVADGKGGTDTSTLTLSMESRQDVPTDGDETNTVVEDTTLTVTDGAAGDLLNNASDPDGDNLTITGFTIAGIAGNQPVGQAVAIPGVGSITINANGSYSFTPAQNYAGAVPVITYTVSDGKGGSDTSTLTLTMDPRQDVPTDGDEANSTEEDTVLTVLDGAPGDLLNNANDPDGDPLTITGYTIAGIAGTQPVGQAVVIPGVGSITINANGSYSFAPAQDYTGAVPVITYTVSDGKGGTDTSTLTLSVGGKNDAPTDGDETNTVVEDTTLTVANGAAGDLLNNANDPDGDVLTITGYTIAGIAGNQPIGQAVAIPGVGSITINANGSYSFTPALNFTGAIPVITYTVSDGKGGTDTSTLTLSIDARQDVPTDGDETNTVIEDTTLTVADGAAGDLLNNANDPDGDVLTITNFTIAGIAGNQPIGQAVAIPGVGSITINANGSYSFTPAQNFTGAIPVITYTVSDGKGGTDTSTLTLSIDARQDVPTDGDETNTVIEDTTLTVADGAAGDLLNNANDPDGDVLTITGYTIAGIAGNQPIGQAVAIPGVGSITINANGSYSFTPALNFTGAIPVITYTVSDGKGGTDTSTLTLSIDARQDVPTDGDETNTVIEDTTLTVADGAAGDLLNNANDPDGDVLTITNFTIAGIVGNQPIGQAVAIPGVGSVTINANGSYSFTPALNFTGAIPVITYTVSDGKGGTDTSTLTLSIDARQDVPTDGDETNTVIEDTTLTVADGAAGDLLNNANDPDGDVLTITGYTIAGIAGNQPIGQAVAIPGVGSITINANGSYSFTPALNFTGAIPVITYTVSDGKGGTDTSTLTLSIDARQDVPTDGDETNTVIEDTTLTVADGAAGDLLNNANDPDGDVLTITNFTIAGIAGNQPLGQAVAIPGVGSITINANGSYSFTPALNFTGAIPVITYTVSDGKGGTDTSTLTLSIDPRQDVPTDGDETNTVIEDTTLTVADGAAGDLLNNANDPDGDVLTITGYTIAGIAGNQPIGQAVAIPGVGSITINANGSYSFNPALNYTGAIPVITYTVSDGKGGTDTSTLTLTMEGRPDTPDSANVSRTTNEDTNYVVKLADFAFTDGDGDTLTAVRITTLPTDGKLLLNGQVVQAGTEVTVAQLNAGSLVFAPDQHESNSPYATFTFQVKDSTGALDATANTFTMNVTAVPDAPTLTTGQKQLAIAENFEEIDLGQTNGTPNYFKNTDVTSLTGGIWRTDNAAVGANPKSVEVAAFANTFAYGATSNGSNGTRAVELEQNPNDRSNLYTEIAVEKGEVFSFSFDAAARQNNNGGPIANKTSVFYVYWEGQLVYTFNSLSGTFTNFQLDLVATQTGNARLEFIAADSDSFGAMVDNIKVDLRQNTGVQGYVVNVPDITAGLVDKDGSETLAIRVESIPVGAVLTDGVNTFTSVAGATTATVTGWDLTKISLLPPAAFSGTIDLNVVATATETSNNTSVSTSKQVQLTVLADANNQYGAAADDTLSGTASADRLWGFEGNDRLSGAAGNDTVIGGLGNDTLAGDDGNDLLDGGVGTDSLSGGLGIDTLQGGKGNDTLTGNDGNDVFRWSLGDGGTGGAPVRDVITDFSTSAVGGDILDLRDLLQGEEVNVTTNLHNYIDIDTTSVAGQTIIRISSTGGFTNGVYDASKEDQSITLSNIDLRAALGRPNGTDLDLLRDLVARKQLIVDGV